MKTKPLSRTKQGKRVYLNNVKTRNLIKALTGFFESYVDVSRMRVGKQQTIETLVNEETLHLAKFLRKERTLWTPRIVIIETEMPE